MLQSEHSRRWIVALLLPAIFFGPVSNVAGLQVVRPASKMKAAPGKQRARAKSTGRISTRSAQPGASPSPTPTPTPPPCQDDRGPEEDKVAGQKVKLFYLREAGKIVTILNAVAKQKGSGLEDLVIANATEDEIILYGPKNQRNYARRVIATLDLPRPGIDMEMWGIQLSSRKPEDMAEVMRQVREEINRTQQAVRETYAQLQKLALKAIPDESLDTNFSSLLQGTLHYESALNSNRPLSLTDILLRMIAAQDPSKAAQEIANGLNLWLQTHPRYGSYAKALTNPKSQQCPPKKKVRVRAEPEAPAETGRQPFERFFRTRGLSYDGANWVEDNNEAKRRAWQGRIALLEFALHYGRLVHQPECFNPYSLQQSAEILNSRLQAAIDALNLDMEELFVLPTLDRIRCIVGRFKDVEYAQVGKTSVASLSGVSTEVTSHSVSAFDVTPPLRLSELLETANKLSTGLGPFTKETKPDATEATERMVGTVPLSQIIGLIAAFGEERSVWRELQSGISLNITPNVLRNATSAELLVDLKTGDPQAGTREQGVRPLSRVSQHDVKTTVYVNALDFFDLSAFLSQSTLDGGRGYIPIIGPIWRGLFSDVPVFGNLLSWKKSPQNVYHQSLVLTNSFITPTAMGVAVLYPTEFVDSKGEKIPYNTNVFKDQVDQVKTYRLILEKALGER